MLHSSSSPFLFIATMVTTATAIAIVIATATATERVISQWLGDVLLLCFLTI
jgi:hypothetical protein